MASIYAKRTTGIAADLPVQHQAEMLAVSMLHLNQDFTLSDLARRLGVPASTLHLETRRMVDAGLLTSRQVGRSRLLRSNTDNRIVGPLTDLLAATFRACRSSKRSSLTSLMLTWSSSSAPGRPATPAWPAWRPTTSTSWS